MSDLHGYVHPSHGIFKNHLFSQVLCSESVRTNYHVLSLKQFDFFIKHDHTRSLGELNEVSNHLLG